VWFLAGGTTRLKKDFDNRGNFLYDIKNAEMRYFLRR
jgi:hypothetical protein